ncbi:hypothetical protein EYF80_007785 [Liparis tanakae]|uniref:Uncharacterized protein n=1 Tax=Liparis tanakae TaxID=230148 RepID=A0A4Z2IVV4_9TELE|nr:hypothetical protein EYF80_007785 [Liparis tanakae]
MRVVNIVGFRRGYNFINELQGLAKPFGKVVKHLVLDLRPEGFTQVLMEDLLAVRRHRCPDRPKRDNSSLSPASSQQPEEPPAKKSKEEEKPEEEQQKEEQQQEEEEEEEEEEQQKEEVEATGEEDVQSCDDETKEAPPPEQSPEGRGQPSEDVKQEEQEEQEEQVEQKEQKEQAEQEEQMETSSNQNGQTEAPPPAENKSNVASLPLPPHDPTTPIGETECYCASAAGFL